MISKTKAALVASTLLLAPAAALAQGQVTEQAGEVAEQAEQVEQAANALSNTVVDEGREAGDDTAAAGGELGDDERRGDGDDDFPWGLLGLLGLAGLLGLKRRDDDRRDVHVDNRTGTGTHTGTGTGMGTGTGRDTDNRL